MWGCKSAGCQEGGFWLEGKVRINDPKAGLFDKVEKYQRSKYSFECSKHKGGWWEMKPAVVLSQIIEGL